MLTHSIQNDSLCIKAGPTSMTGKNLFGPASGFSKSCLKPSKTELSLASFKTLMQRLKWKNWLIQIRSASTGMSSLLIKYYTLQYKNLTYIVSRHHGNTLTLALWETKF